jgi:hypothetical protein
VRPRGERVAIVSTCLEDPSARPMAVTLAERLLAYVREDRTLTVRVHVVDRAEALVQREHPNVGRCTPANRAVRPA